MNQHLFHYLCAEQSWYMRGQELKECVAVTQECQQNYGHLEGVWFEASLNLNSHNLVLITQNSNSYLISYYLFLSLTHSQFFWLQFSLCKTQLYLKMVELDWVKTALPPYLCEYALSN